MTFDIKLYTSIHEVPHHDWDSIAPKAYVGLESQHLKALELSRLNDLKPYYVLAYGADGTPQAIAYFFIMTMDFSALGTEVPPLVRKAVKTWMPNFLTFKIIECGFISALGESIACRNELNLSPFILKVSELMEMVGKTENVDLVFIRDIPFERHSFYKPLYNEDYDSTLGFPIAKMEVKWNNFDEYLQSMKKKTRVNIKQRLSKLNDPSLQVECIQNYGSLADQLEKLWLQVEQKAVQYSHERLTAAYFRNLCVCLPEKTHIIAIKKDKEIIGFYLNLVGEREFFSAFCGINYTYNDDYNTYFNLYFLTLKEVFKRKKDIFNLGITSYDFKTYTGGELHPILYFVKFLKNYPRGLQD